MASTYKPRQAFNKALRYVKNMPLRTVQVPILDQINKMMWMYAPWRWTIGSLPAVTLASDTQDYTIALPSDYLYATDAYLADGDAQFETLLVEPSLPTDVKVVGRPKRLAISGTAGSSGTLRVAAKPGTLTNTPDIISMYKKTSPVITAKNAHTAGVLTFPDEWFWVFEEGVLWQSYIFADDTRAGQAQVDATGRMQFSGQRGCFEAALQQMRIREKLPEPDPTAKSETRGTRG